MFVSRERGVWTICYMECSYGLDGSWGMVTGDIDVCL